MEKTTLDNGLVILTKPVTTNSLVSVVVTMKMGSLYENDDKAGISNLMQETILKGTKNRTSEQIALELETLGTRISAGAQREYGTISLMSTSASLYKSLEILYDVLLNATFPADALDLQKNLQKKNLLLRNDQPLYRAMDLMVDAHFGDHPFHKPSMGYEESIDGATQKDIIDFYNQVFIPNNMVVTAVGNFDKTKLHANIADNLGAMTKSNMISIAPGEVHEMPDHVENIEKREIAASWFALGWPSASMDDSDYYAMEVLDAITGGSMNSRLFVAIREERGLAYQVSSFVNPRIAAGLFVAYVGTQPSTYEEAKQVLIDEIGLMTSEDATQDEITLAKSYLKGMNIMGLESNSGQAAKYGRLEILGMGFEFGDDYNAGIDKITASDIRQAGQKYLNGSYALGAVLAQ